MAKFRTSSASGPAPSSGAWNLEQTIDLTTLSDATYSSTDIGGTTITNNSIEIGGQVMQTGVSLQAINGDGLYVNGANLGIFSVGPSFDFSTSSLWAIIADFTGGDSASRTIGVGLGSGSRNLEADQARVVRTKDFSGFIRGDVFDGSFRPGFSSNTLSGQVTHLCAIISPNSVIGYGSLSSDTMPAVPGPDDFPLSNSANAGSGNIDFSSSLVYPVIIADSNSGVYGYRQFRIYSLSSA